MTQLIFVSPRANLKLHVLHLEWKILRNEWRTFFNYIKVLGKSGRPSVETISQISHCFVFYFIFIYFEFIHSKNLYKKIQYDNEKNSDK